MEQIEVITDAIGTKCRTVNPYGEKKDNVCIGWWPNNGIYGTYDLYEKRWKQAEAERKEYKMASCNIACSPSDFYIEGKCGKNFCCLLPNTRYTAELIDENTVRVLNKV